MRPLLFAAVAVSMLAACAASPPYRTEPGPNGQHACTLGPPTRAPDGTVVWETQTPDSPCKSSWAVRSDGHGIDYVEIDEQGVISNRRAMEDALAYAAAPSPDGNPAYVVVFIHGWHHNGEAADGNVQAFHSALEALKAWHRTSDVRGIYISWRGESFNAPVLHNLTFWDRKNTSDEVGRGGLLEFLLRLEHAVQPTALGQTGEPPKPNKLVLIGHSFGASVAFNALAHVYMERFIDGVYATAPGPRFRGYGDLVVLINPAIEAMRYQPFESAVRYYATRADAPRADFQYETVPRLVILSSLGDWATRITFPAARFFTTVLEQHGHVGDGAMPDDGRVVSEWVLDRDTVGNYENFATHWPLHIVTHSPVAPNQIAQNDSPQIRSLAEPPHAGGCTPLGRGEIRRRLAIDAATDPTAAAPAPQPGFEAFPDSDIQIVRKPTAVKGSPYVLADVGKEIIADHTKIDNKNLICWIDQLVSGF